MVAGRSDLVDLELFVHHATERAILVSLDGNIGNKVWLPKEPCDWEGELRMGKYQEITMPEYLATDKGLT